MDRRIRSSWVALLCAVSMLGGCTTDGTTTADLTTAVPPPELGWRLPKTVLDTTVTWTPTKCSMDKGHPVVTADVTVALAARGVPDPDLGPADKYPNGLVTVASGNLQSFWIDSNLTYKLYAGRGGLLQSLSSHSTGETGPIVGNFLTGITKIVAAAVPAPAGKSPLTGDVCGAANGVLDQIAALRTKIKTANAKDAADLATQVQSLKDSITVTVKKTIDPGSTTDPVQGGVLKTLVPDTAAVIKAGWYGEGAATISNPPDSLQVKIRFDFAKGVLCPACKDAIASGAIARTTLPDSTLFRQAAYIPVSAEQGPWSAIPGTNFGHGSAIGDTQIIAFGQFGKAASLPVKVKSFQDINWEVDFSDLGEVTTTTYASKATGTAVSTLFSGATTSASAVQSSLATAATAPSSETAKLTVENTALKAQIDNKTYKTQLEAMGTSSSASPEP